MVTVSVVIPATRPSVDDLIISLSWGTRIPDEFIVVSNEVRPDAMQSVTLVGFDSATQPYGKGDAGLRRNIGADVAESDIIVFLDDDLIAPVDMLGMAVEIAEREGFCWGHHRYIDFEKYSIDDMLTMGPVVGRSREAYVNDWHGWQSSYAGLLAIRRDLFWETGGFDLAYLGYHGSEDQQLGYRLGAKEGHRTFVHEPPFAWHPETPLFHSEPASNIMGTHRMVRTTINGFDFSACEECPCREPIDVRGMTTQETVIISYNREQFTLKKERI